MYNVMSAFKKFTYTCTKERKAVTTTMSSNHELQMNSSSLKIGVDIKLIQKQEHQIKNGAVLFLQVGRSVFRLLHTQASYNTQSVCIILVPSYPGLPVYIFAMYNTQYCVNYMPQLTHHGGHCPWLLDTQRSDHLEDIHSTLSLAALHSIHEGTEYPRTAHSITACVGEGGAWEWLSL